MSTPCPNCGRLNRPGARFCASCQTALNGPEDPSAGRTFPTEVPPLQPGQLLGGGAFRLVRPLGKGGMGATFLVAQTRAFDRLAVLKEVIDYFDLADAQARQEAVERFEAEARMLAELKHPGIPDLYAYFSEGNHNYLVMEYIEGPDLSRGLTRQDPDTGDMIPGAPLPPDRTLQYAIQICEVLEYLADRKPSVIHNDIKPGNILLDSHSGRAVLVDFGTAKTRHVQAVGRPDQKKDAVYGTVGYAAPELYQGRSEPRSDVYSLAATVYHLMTDDDPRDHPGQYPQLDTMPEALAVILRGALEPDVNRRSTAAEFRRQLESYLAGQTGGMRVLTFPDGDTANGREELVAQATKHWGFTANLLLDGTLARWLRGTLRDAAAAQAAEGAAQQWPGNPDASLDAFLRRLDPTALPPGKLELRTASIRLPGVGPGQTIQAKIEIANRGQGYLRGEAFSTMPWVHVGSTFGCPPGDVTSVPIEIDPSGLAPGQPHLAAVTLAPAAGGPEVVPVEVIISGPGLAPVQGPPVAPGITVNPRRIDLTAARRDFTSNRGRLMVANVGSVPALCRVLGAPAWLLVKPGVFPLPVGGRQAVEMVARVGKVQDRRQEVTLDVAVEGGQGREVRVSIQIKGAGLFG